MNLIHRQLGPDSSLRVGAPVAVNALGFNAHQTWALWRAQANAFVESPFFCRNGRRATMALNRTLPERSAAPERASRMTLQALEQLEPYLRRLTGKRPCLALAVTDKDWSDRSRFVSHASTTTALDYLSSHGFAGIVEVCAQGHASLASALLKALAPLESGDADFAIVGGVDTYHDPEIVEQLLQEGRLFDLEDFDSILPGEGAAFFLVGPASVLEAAGVRAEARLEAAATADEPAPMLGQREGTFTARGLTHAMKSVTWYLKKDRRRLDWIVGDMTNETYRVIEYQLTFPRILAPGGLDDLGASYAEIATEDLMVDFIPERFGDMGAASMPTAIVLALESFRRGAPRARTCLVFGSSPTGARGAVLISSMEQ